MFILQEKNKKNRIFTILSIILHKSISSTFLIGCTSPSVNAETTPHWYLTFPLFRFSQSSLSSPLLHPSTTAARATEVSSLRSPPSRWGWPQPVQPRSRYPFTAWERIQTRAHRDQFKALHMKSLPLQWYLSLHLHIHIFRTWCLLPVCAR